MRKRLINQSALFIIEQEAIFICILVRKRDVFA